jgi:predicted peptidase
LGDSLAGNRAAALWFLEAEEMKRGKSTIALVVLLAVAVACGSAPEAPPPQTGVHLQARFEIPESLEEQPPSHPGMDYLVWLPEGYGQDPEVQWPLIFFLHGAGSDVNDSKFVMSYGLPEVLYSGDQPQDFPFVVVSPQAFPGVPWWEGDTVTILNALLDEVVATYQVDPNRVYLTGLSMGGYGSWWLATAYPDRFAAMVSVSGSGYRTATAPEAEVVCKMRDLPVWAIHGERDMISDPMANKIQLLTLGACGGEVEWTLYPDAGHGEAYARAYRDPALYTWLLEHSREP